MDKQPNKVKPNDQYWKSDISRRSMGSIIRIQPQEDYLPLPSIKKHKKINQAHIWKPKLTPAIMEELWKDYKKRKKRKRQANKEIEERDPQRTISYRPSKDGLFVYAIGKEKKILFHFLFVKIKKTLSPQIKPSKKAQEQPTKQDTHTCMYQEGIKIRN